MKCTACKADQLKVYNSRPQDDNTIKRRRICLNCGNRLTTREAIDESDNKGPGRPGK